MRKKFLAVLLMFLCVFSLCGCASVSFNNIIFSDGKIAQQIVVVTDNKQIQNAGFDVQTVQTDIKFYATQYYNTLLSNFLFADIPGLEQSEKNTPLFKTESKNNVVNIVVQFNTIQDYYYFYNHALPDQDDNNGTVNDFGFYQTDETTSTTVFYDLQNNNVANYWLNYFKTKMPQVSFADCTYNYTYSTPFEKIHSDADIVQYDDYGNVAHTWSFKSADLTGENAAEGGKIKLYTVGIKSPLWYFVAIGATAVLVAVLYIVCAVKDNKSKKAKLADGTTTNVEIK